MISKLRVLDSSVSVSEHQVPLSGVRPPRHVGEQVVHLDAVREDVVVPVVAHLEDVLHVVILLKMKCKSQSIKDHTSDLRPRKGILTSLGVLEQALFQLVDPILKVGTGLNCSGQRSRNFAVEGENSGGGTLANCSQVTLSLLA